MLFIQVVAQTLVALRPSIQQVSPQRQVRCMVGKLLLAARNGGAVVPLTGELVDVRGLSRRTKPAWPAFRTVLPIEQKVDYGPAV